MAKPIPVHYKISDRIMDLLSKGYQGRSSQERMIGNNYTQVRTPEDGFMLRQELTILDIHIYDDLDLNAIKLLIQIQQELQRNNPIWECKDMEKSSVRLGLAQLKQKDIIESLNDNIFIVNPEKIRRGKPLACLAAIYQYSKRKWQQDKSWRISSEDIKNLAIPKDETLLIEDITNNKTNNNE